MSIFLGNKLIIGNIMFCQGYKGERGGEMSEVRVANREDITFARSVRSLILFRIAEPFFARMAISLVGSLTTLAYSC
mgnify:CR=1 FL=1